MININSDLYPNRIALLYSGGADSTLLYYLLANDIITKANDKQLDLFIVDRYNKPIDKAMYLYNKIKAEINDTFTNIKVIAQPPFIPGYNQVLNCASRIRSQYDVVLWAANMYPDDTIIRPQKDYTINFERYLNHPYIKLPFGNYTKINIIDTFIKLGIEHILNETHSCGNPGDNPCGQCFNCRERIWAYEQLGLEPNLGV